MGSRDAEAFVTVSGTWGGSVDEPEWGSGDAYGSNSARSGAGRVLGVTEDAGVVSGRVFAAGLGGGAFGVSTRDGPGVVGDVAASSSDMASERGEER